MAIRRVALIFDNSGRGETTGTYCRRALGNLVEVEHFLPHELGSIPTDGFDLYLNIDDGLKYKLPAQLRPCAYWAIDTHMDLNWAREKAADFDFVFAAQRDGAEALSAIWLPLACDPIVHRRYNTTEEYDIAFVGNVFPGPRADSLQRLENEFEKTFVGRAYYEQMALVYSQTKVAFNRSVKNDVNMRVFEALSCGAMLLTNDLAANGQDELFRDGVNVVTYQSDDELLDKAKFYLSNDELRQQIARQGRIEAHHRHTYVHRMHAILRAVEGKPSTANLRASACLLNWKRPGNILEIVQELQSNPLIDDIVVWNNNPTPLQIPDDNVKVINAEKNYVTYGRFLCTQHAKHDLIFTQDDDCIVGNIAELAQSFVVDPTRITHGLKIGHLLNNAAENVHDQAQISLLGWGALYDRRWLKVLDQYRDVFGEDDLLCRKADRIVTMLLGRRHRSIPALVRDLPGTASPDALSVRDDHQRLTMMAASRVIGLLDRQGPPVELENPLSNQQSPEVSKDTSYFEFARPEIAEQIPHTAKRVLDVGCGAGMLGHHLKSRRSIEVWGIEREPDVAEIARQRLDNVLCGDATSLAEDVPQCHFDVIVCGDVLEHMRDPGEFLRLARQWLTPKGRLIASIPNARHYSVLASLADGNWTYERAGLLDEDHVRFFTRREIEKLFYRTGYRVTDLAVVPGPGYRSWEEQGRPQDLSFGKVQITGLTKADAQELFVYQYILGVEPAPIRSYGKTSIIILAHNELSYSRQCIDSIAQFTDEPYELVLVDNGSSDGTDRYFQSIAGAKVIINKENLGFPKGVNQGIQESTGQYVVLLNNDTIVSTGWLRRMLDAFSTDSSIGVVGPVSNNVSGTQQVPVSYQDVSGIDGFAWDWGKANDRQLADIDRLVGFCMCIDRRVIDKVGVLDERFGIGCFEDDDFTRRARDAGFRTVVARDSFVHHFGSRTFVGSGVDLGDVLKTNQQRYNEKWQEAPSTAQTNTRHKGVLALEAGLRLVPQRVHLSLCMIVRDNENTLRPCLESIRPWVDEMIIVDTGSMDATPQIAAEYGAKVYHFPWCDDFSAARNESLKYATGEWIFWMDSDDTIPEECGHRLRALAYSFHEPNHLGYLMQVHCPSSGDGQKETTVVDQVKLIKNRSDLRFEMRIHEQIIPSIRRAGGDVTWTDIYVVHSGSDSTTEGRKRKLERDLRILDAEINERPEHPFALFNLGMTHADAGNHEVAVDYFRRSIQVATPQESHVPKAYALLVLSLTAMDDIEEAKEVCSAGLELFPDDAELHFRLGLLYHHQQDLAKAEANYKQALAPRKQRKLSSVVEGISGHLARHNLALVYQDMGRLGEAEEEWKRVLESRSDFQPAWRGLMQVLEQQGKHEELAKLDLGAMDGLASVCRARKLEREGDIQGAAMALEAAIQDAPSDAEPLRELCRLLFEHSGPETAEPYLVQLAQQDPLDPSAPRNLGTVRSVLGDLEGAQAYFRQSLAIRPDSPETWLQLVDVVNRGAGPEQAASVLREAIDACPSDCRLRETLEELEGSYA